MECRNRRFFEVANEQIYLTGTLWFFAGPANFRFDDPVDFDTERLGPIDSGMPLHIAERQERRLYQGKGHRDAE